MRNGALVPYHILQTMIINGQYNELVDLLSKWVKEKDDAIVG